MATYNGHKNYNHWNVSLWINNDEGLYNHARRCVRQHRTKGEAARALLAELRGGGIYETSDGVRYSITTIKAAMSGM